MDTIYGRIVVEYATAVYDFLTSREPAFYLTALIALAGLVRAQMAYRRAKTSKKFLAVVGGGKTLSEHVDERYQDSNVDKPTDERWDAVEDDWYDTFRELRHDAERHFQEWDPDEREAWDEKSQYMQSTRAEFAAAELAGRLQKLAITVYAGTVPLDYVLLEIGDHVIEDWRMCRSWVRTYREGPDQDGRDRSPARSTARSGPVHYQRRHAEWLAMIAALWWLTAEYETRTDDWTTDAAEDIVESVGGSKSKKRNLKRTRKRISQIQQADDQLLERFVRREVDELIG